MGKVIAESLGTVHTQCQQLKKKKKFLYEISSFFDII